MQRVPFDEYTGQRKCENRQRQYCQLSTTPIEKGLFREQAKIIFGTGPKELESKIKIKFMKNKSGPTEKKQPERLEKTDTGAVERQLVIREQIEKEEGGDKAKQGRTLQGIIEEQERIREKKVGTEELQSLNKWTGIVGEEEEGDRGDFWEWTKEEEKLFEESQRDLEEVVRREIEKRIKKNQHRY